MSIATKMASEHASPKFTAQWTKRPLDLEPLIVQDYTERQPERGKQEMHTTTLRKVGGSAMLAVKEGCLVVKSTPRLRYTLDKLLAQTEASGAYPLPPDEREWMDAPPVGRELI